MTGDGEIKQVDKIDNQAGETGQRDVNDFDLRSTSAIR